jgi:general secretion pathway protein H
MIGQRTPGERGFTLIEILVVLLIVGVLTGIAVLSLSSLGQASRREQAARRLAGLIELASQQAIIQGETYGLCLEPHHYWFLRDERGQWVHFAHDSIYRRRSLPGALRISLRLTGTRLHLLARPSARKTTVRRKTHTPARHLRVAHRPPDILILPNGQLSAFEIDISVRSHRRSFRIRGTISGHLSLIAPHHAPT